MAEINLSLKFLNKELLISEDFLNQITPSSHIFNLSNDSVYSFSSWEGDTGRKRYEVINGIAVIHIQGPMFEGADYSYDWGTGYNFIRNAVKQANNDDSVSGILLHSNTPGGTVDGVFQTQKVIANSKKPVQAQVTQAYSGGMLLVAGVEKITIDPLGGMGSIGVVTRHVDMSKMLDKEGYKVTLIFKGKQKVDGNPYEPLPEDVKKRIENRLELIYQNFIDVVASGRKIDSQVVRDTEAALFSADEAISLGLGDAKGYLEDTLKHFKAANVGNLHTGEKMSKENLQEGADTTNGTEAKNTTTVDVAELTRQAVAAERLRTSTILGLPEAQNRQKLALELTRQDISVETAKVILAAASEETQAAKNPLEEAMGTDPKYTQSLKDESGSDSTENEVLKNWMLVTGKKPD